MIKLYCLVLANLVFFFSYSQEITDQKVVYNYSVKDGLASNQVLYSMQDSKGFMWFATGGGGVSRFDGHTFETFDISDGLTDNEVFTMYEDVAGRIWFGTYNCQLSYFLNDSIYEYEHNEVIGAQVPDKSLISRLHHDEQGNLYLYFVNWPMVMIDLEGKAKDFKTTDRISQIDIHMHSNRLLASSYWETRLPEDNVELRFYNRDKRGFASRVLDRPKAFDQLAPRCFVTRNEKDTFLFANTHILRINQSMRGKEEFMPPSAFLKSLYVVNIFEKDNTFWLLLKNNGIVRGTVEGDHFEVQGHTFKDEYITYITEDADGGMWLCTHDRGLLYIPYPDIDSNPKPATWYKGAKNISVRDEESLAFAISPSVFLVKHHGRYDTLALDLPESSYITDLVYSEQGDTLYVSGETFSRIYVVNPTGLKLLPIDLGFASTVAYVLSQGKILLRHGKDVYDFNDLNRGQTPLFTFSKRGEIFGALENRILVGSNSGLEEFESFNKEWRPRTFIDENPVYGAFIQDFENYREGIWIATRGRGIAFYTDSIAFILGLEAGLSTLNLTDLQQEGDTLWVSSDTGLDKLVFDGNMNVISTSHYTSSNGLSANYVFGVETSADAIYISTELGVDRIKRSELNASHGIKEVRVGSLELSESGADSTCATLSLTYEQNDLELNYQALEFRAMGTQEFRYRLIPVHSSWNYTTQRKVDFNDLAPASYSFAVQVKDIYGNWSPSEELDFVITPPFWSTWYFRTALAFLFFGGIYYGVKRREKALRDKFLLEDQIEGLREKALRAQINPHFLFNTLNSIQNFILKGDFEASNKYLTQFSRLIRMILTQSDKAFISIKDEVNMLSMYLKLEQMRFDQGFDFKLTIADDINGGLTNIPSMMIQPYVENAIWHGLARESRAGMVEVIFSEGVGNRKRTHVLCVIRDNGIGRAAAQALQSGNARERKSVGMSLTKKRLNILDRRSESEIEVIDLHAMEGKPSGTEIRIHLPYKKKE